MAEPQAPTKVAIVAISRTGLELSWNGMGTGDVVRTCLRWNAEMAVVTNHINLIEIVVVCITRLFVLRSGPQVYNAVGESLRR